MAISNNAMARAIPKDAIPVVEGGEVVKHVVKQGCGEVPVMHARCFVHYTGYLQENGEQFACTRDEGSGEPFQIIAGRVLSDPKGLAIGVASMRKGEECWLYLKPGYGYGAKGSFSFPHVPSRANLAYRITLLEWTAPDEEKPRGDMFFEERLEAAERRKEAANKVYAAQDYGQAMQAYTIALSYVNEDFAFQLEREHLAMANAIRIPILLNLCQCALKLEQFDDAIAHAGQVLREDKQNVKALYRQGLGMLSLGQSDQAGQVLRAALKLKPGDASIKAALRRVQREEADMRKAEKDLFGGKLGDRASEDAPEEANQTETDLNQSNQSWLGTLTSFLFPNRRNAKTP